MTTNLTPTLEYIHDIKEDIRLAINSRGGVVTGGVPFEQWGSVLAGLAFSQGTVQYPGTKPVKPKPKPTPVVTPYNPADLPSDFDIGTSGLTPIAVGFAYGSLQFDFTGAVGSVEGLIDPKPIPEPTPEPEPIANEYAFTINGQPPDVMTGVGTFNESTGTFTGYLWDDSLRTPGSPCSPDDPDSRDWCGSDASCAWYYASYDHLGYGNVITVGVENLPVTLYSAVVPVILRMDGGIRISAKYGFNFISPGETHINRLHPIQPWSSSLDVGGYFNKLLSATVPDGLRHGSAYFNWWVNLLSDLDASDTYESAYASNFTISYDISATGNIQEMLDVKFPGLGLHEQLAGFVATYNPSTFNVKNQPGNLALNGLIHRASSPIGFADERSEYVEYDGVSYLLEYGRAKELFNFEADITMTFSGVLLNSENNTA